MCKRHTRPYSSIRGIIFYKAPYIPPNDPLNPTGTQNFDEIFDFLEPVISDEDNLDGQRARAD